MLSVKQPPSFLGVTDHDESPLCPEPGAHVRVLRNRKQILALQDILVAFAEISGQSGSLSDLEYFLDKPGVLHRCPVLVLLARPEAAGQQELAAQDLLGAILLYEYCPLGLRTGIYTSNDRSGRSTLVAPLGRRERVARLLVHGLYQKGAHVILFSYRGQPHGGVQDSPFRLTESADALWGTRERVVPDQLELAPTFELTLATIGQRTRSNMRYYRRRAERELGCVFVPEAKIAPEELQAFNKECMYAVGDGLARWRVGTLSLLKDPILAGIRDKHGQWISLLGGRRQGSHTEVLWQMNRKDLPNYSVSLVLRSYLIEHEVQRGATRFSIEGGTPHPLSNSFRQERIRDVLTLRRTFRARLALYLAGRFPGVSNELITMLEEPALGQISWKRKTGRLSFSDVAAMGHPSDLQEASAGQLRGTLHGRAVLGTSISLTPDG